MINLSPHHQSTDFDLNLNEPSEEGLNDELMLATIFDKYPSKRKLIRDTNKIKVTFGQFESKLLFPRMDNNHRVQGQFDDSIDLIKVENEVGEQAQKLKLLEHVQSSGLIKGKLV